jgi:23S rRNA (guanosine2251-2'-O)-methyltransferase
LVSVIAGLQAVREALRASPERVRKVVLSEGRLDARAHEILTLARDGGVPVYREKPKVLERLASGGHHQGVVAEMAGVRWWDLDELLSTSPKPALFLALDQIEDPRNLGAVARTADGAGVSGILMPKRGVAPPSAAAISASAGALLHARLARVTNLVASLERVKKDGIWVVGLAPEGSLPWYRFDYTVPLILVLGSEGKGLRPLVARTCDALVSLPQLGHVDSLNLSVAAGVVLYEVLRQRAGDGGPSGGLKMSAK